MSRRPQGRVARGSQRWLQDLASNAPHLFDREVLARLHPPCDSSIDWLSPLESDDFAEYQDGAFLKRLEIALPRRPLASFWPRRGPVWDGLARTARGDILLIEAKANIPELASPATQASPKSKELIKASLVEAKPAFGAPREADWSSTYYQYANRLAHLYLLRAVNQISAYLVFIYFTNADDVSGPSTAEAWQPEIRRCHEALNLGNGPLSAFVLSVFIDVTGISASAP